MIVKKRCGKEETLDINKINKVLEWATEGLSGVSSDIIAINAKINFRVGISTDEIHKVLIETAANLISENAPNYQHVAGRLLNYQLRKQVWGGKNPPKLHDFIANNIKKGIYAKSLVTDYSETEINKIGEFINHDRDFIFAYSGIKQMCDKYLIKNKISGEIHETPQFAYLCLAMAGFARYEKSIRLGYVKNAYNYFSKHKINIPTPIMAGLRSNFNSYSSCCLVDIDDTKESLTASATAISLATAARYGIGINIGRIRPLGSPIRGGETVHTGLIPFLKIYEASVKAWQQSAIRGGSATVSIPWWHYEIEDVIVLKNNAGTDDNRVRKLDYSVGCSKIFYERVKNNESITLFSPHEAKDVFETFGLDTFDEAYKTAESNPKLKFKKVIPARKLMSLIVKERVETGRIYVINMDHANSHSSFKDRVLMGNLCQEVIQPLIPIQDINDENGEIGVCILGAINLLEIKNDEEMEKACDIIVRLLEEVIDIQSYFCKAAEKFAKNWRSLGIGITNLAGLLAHNGLKYSSPEAPNFVDEWMEKVQYYSIKSSVELAKERGPCNYYKKTKFSDQILSIDTYKKSIDKVVTRKPTQDWTGLRKEIEKNGIRHATLTSVMPCESSSSLTGSTNGVEPVRSLVSFKESKEGRLPVMVPGLVKHKKDYELAFDILDNKGIIDINAAIQKWTCMAISTNLYYNYAHYPGNAIPDSKVIQDIMYAYSMGLKSLYYSNSEIGSKEQIMTLSCDGACQI